MGGAIPVKFSLGGNRGTNIFAAGYPRSGPVSCSSGAETGPSAPTDTPGSSNLSYGGGTYNYVWKTNSAWKGQCRRFTLRLTDGAEHHFTVEFR